VLCGVTVIATFALTHWLLGVGQSRRLRVHRHNLSYPEGQVALPMPRGYFDRG